MRASTFFCRAVSSFGAVCLGLALLAPAAAQDDTGKLSAAVGNLAQEIAAFMRANGQDELVLGSFTTTQPGFGEGAGAAIRKLLADELSKAGVEIKKARTRFACTGEFTFFSEDGSSGKALIEVVLRENTIKRKTFAKEIFDVSDIATLMGATGKLPTDPAKRSEGLQTSIENPQPQVEPSPPETAQGSKVQVRPANVRARAAKGGDYALEIWRLKDEKRGVANPTDDDYEPLPIAEEDQLLFVDLEKDNIYAVRLVNNTDRLAAVTLTIDGLNMFAFSSVPGYKALGKVLVPPGPQGVLIKGWHHTNEKSFLFEVVDVGDAAVAEVDSPGIAIEERTGVITARFAVAVDVAKGEAFPADEPNTASLGTKVGPEFDARYNEVQVRIGVDREVITVRYSRPLPKA